MDPTELIETCAKIANRASESAGGILADRPRWQSDNRALQQFWEETLGQPPANPLLHLRPGQRERLHSAMVGLESQAEAARKDLLRLQHAAGAIAHALNHSYTG